MSQGAFENDEDQTAGLATGAGPTESGGEQPQDQEDGPERDGDSADQDGNALDDVNLEPPSS